MCTLKERWLWVGFAASVALGVMLHTLQLWASGDPPWPALQVLLHVGFWFCMTSAVVLAVLALRLGTLVSPGGRRPPRTALLVGVAAVLGVAFVVICATRNWLIFTSPGSSEPAGLISFVADALVGLIEVAAGSLIALATLTLLASGNRPPVQDVEPHHESAIPEDGTYNG